jgi:hypothetical protein
MLIGAKKELAQETHWKMDYPLYAHCTVSGRTEQKGANGYELLAVRKVNNMHIVYSIYSIHPSNRPWRPIGFYDVEVPPFSRQSVHR